MWLLFVVPFVNLPSIDYENFRFRMEVVEFFRLVIQNIVSSNFNQNMSNMFVAVIKLYDLLGDNLSVECLNDVPEFIALVRTIEDIANTLIYGNNSLPYFADSVGHESKELNPTININKNALESFLLDDYRILPLVARKNIAGVILILNPDVIIKTELILYERHYSIQERIISAARKLYHALVCNLCKFNTCTVA